ncbi:MAG: ABC transporter permease [Chloroflexota bacterium]|jgi:oligopeptide transport system permease protein|nr:ABC transporter permease [Chloroflexota bacterium]
MAAVNPPTTLAELAAAGEVTMRKQSSLWADAWRRLVKNKLAVIGMFVVATFVLVAIFAPLIAPYDEAEVVDPRLVRMSPSWTWPMGLDQNGRDIFSRIVWGARVSLFVGVVAYIIVLLIAIPVGSIAGYFGGMIDNMIMRMVDVVFTIPQVLLVLMFVNWRGPGVTNIFLAIGIIGWVTEARLIRGQFLTLREQDYIKASRVAGANPLYIIGRHLLPNSLTPIIVAATFGVPAAIFTEAAVSFAGVGIRPPQASWGQMVGIASQPQYIRTDPHMLLFPVLAIGMTMLGFTFLGDGLRDALDPKGND